MFRKTALDEELESSIRNQRKELEVTFLKTFDTQEQTLDVILKAINHSNFNYFRGNRLIWNVAGYINIASYDLKIIGKELTFSTNEWQKRYFARQACMLIYELSNDIPELIGKKFRTELSKLTDSQILITELNAINKAITEFKKDKQEKLKEIRNVATAHRDKDIFEQLRVIQSIQWNEVIGYLSEFDKIMNRLGNLLQKIINKSVEELDR